MGKVLGMAVKTGLVMAAKTALELPMDKVSALGLMDHVSTLR